MRNIYLKEGIVKLPRPRQFYIGFAISGHGSWSKIQFFKNRWYYENEKTTKRTN